MRYSTVLVTGCGGDIGIGVGRILKSSNAAERVIGCDIHDDHPGEKIFDQCEIVAGVHSKEYAVRLLEVIRTHSVDLIIPTAEPELRFLSAQHIVGTFGGVPMLLANDKAREVGFDKLKTARFLQAGNLPCPWTEVVKDGPPKGFPCIIKSRYGKGSQGVRQVEADLVDHYIRTQPDSIWQEYLSPDDQEYTCGLYRAKNGDTRSIIFRRRLQGGFTGSGNVVANREIEAQLVRIASLLELRGSINVQLRLTERGPVVFEINPRFSSTLVFRHLMGFQDVLWSLMEQSGEPPGTYDPPPVGTRFYRVSREVIL